MQAVAEVIPASRQEKIRSSRLDGKFKKLGHIIQKKKCTTKGDLQLYKTKSLIAILVAIFLIGCAQVTITGSGKVVTQEEAITGFDKVDISQSFSVDITQVESFSVVIRVDDNLAEHLHVVKQGSTLKIGLDPSRSYTIVSATMEAEVTMPELLALDLSGSSEASVSGFESTKSLVVDLSGNSDLRGDIQAGDSRFDVSGNSSVTIAGSAVDVSVDASGSSEADLADFPASDGVVNASGSSTVTVNLSGKLDADASGASDIYYLGEPDLGEIDTSGSSSIQPR